MSSTSIYPDLVGKRALVCGASKGIGLAIASSLLSAGAEVILISRNKLNLQNAAESLSEYSKSLYIYDVDLSHPDFLHLINRKVSDTLNSVDILVNNCSGPPMARLINTTDDMWLDTIHKLLFVPVQLAKAFLPSMVEAHYGRIITVSSSLALEPSPEMILSSTVRAGLGAFTKALSSDYAHKNITANVICPGGVLTERLMDLVSLQASESGKTYDSMLSSIQESIPANRFAEPSEIGSLATFLCSASAGYITGQSIVIDGGVTKSF